MTQHFISTAIFSSECRVSLRDFPNFVLYAANRVMSQDIDVLRRTNVAIYVGDSARRAGCARYDPVYLPKDATRSSVIASRHRSPIAAVDPCGSPMMPLAVTDLTPFLHMD